MLFIKQIRSLFNQLPHLQISCLLFHICIEHLYLSAVTQWLIGQKIKFSAVTQSEHFILNILFMSVNQV